MTEAEYKNILALVNKAADETVGVIATEVHRKIQEYSPKYTGSFAASNMVSVNGSPQRDGYESTEEERKLAQDLGNAGMGRMGTPVPRMKRLMQAEIGKTMDLLSNTHDIETVQYYNNVGHADNVEWGWETAQGYKPYLTVEAEFEVIANNIIKRKSR